MALIPPLFVSIKAMETTRQQQPFATLSPVLTRDVQTAAPYGSAEAVWLALAGIESWCAWSPDLISVSHLDSLPCGRGSRVRFDFTHGEEVWTISYWLPGKRMDLYREIGALKVLRRFELENTAGDGPVTLALSYYCAAKPLWRLLLAPAIYLERQRTNRLFVDLETHLRGR